MKILYAVQATGNGHISRAHQLFPYLSELGEVDIFLSGSNATLPMNIPVKFKSKGLSLFYSQCGGLDYYKTWKNFDFSHIIKTARDLPVKDYDLIINDFDYVTARACRIHKVPSIQFGHQGSFFSSNTPRPENKSIIGELILKKYATATHYVGLHFDRYDSFIFPPVIKQEFINCTPQDHGHVTVYLPAYRTHCIENALRKMAPYQFHWFVPDVEMPSTVGNITYFPVRNQFFNDSLIHAHGLITGGGFETPAEALYLGKRLMSVPIQGQYEQECNAEALRRKGVKVLKDCGDHFAEDISNWLSEPFVRIQQDANDIKETLRYVTNLV
ncbi:MAG: glycosyl transferase [Saprospiraceae bacterium]|nr:glycosyl transferase [Saprospiraceae bacterium]